MVRLPRNRGHCAHDAQRGAARLPVDAHEPAVALRSRGRATRQRPRPGSQRHRVPARPPLWRHASHVPRATASGCSCAHRRRPTCDRTMTRASSHSCATSRHGPDHASRTTSATTPCGTMTSGMKTSGTTTSDHRTSRRSCGRIRHACQRISATMNPSGTNRRSSSVHPTSVNHRYASLHVTTSCLTPLNSLLVRWWCIDE